MHVVESRVEELAAGSLCVVERLIAGLPGAPCGAVRGGECVVRLGRVYTQQPTEVCDRRPRGQLRNCAGS